MSHPKGTYLGGIRTVADLRSRCSVDEYTECWHWQLSMVQGAPKVHFVTPDTGKRIGMRGRRAAVYLDKGHNIEMGRSVFARAMCKSLDCVNPEHSRAGNRDTMGRALAESGRAKNLLSKRAASTATARRTRAKITMDDARQIRVSDETQAALAKQYGIAQSAIWAIKTGKAWCEHAPNASVFTWRP